MSTKGATVIVLGHHVKVPWTSRSGLSADVTIA